MTAKVTKFPSQFGQERWLVGNQGQRVGDAMLVTKAQLEEIVRDGAKALGMTLDDTLARVRVIRQAMCCPQCGSALLDLTSKGSYHCRGCKHAWSREF